MAGDSVTRRDPRFQYWVQTHRPELEGKLGSTFCLANGRLGLRGSHEEMPAWGRPEFYLAGTYTGGPASLLGVHDPDHILTHPDRITPEALARLTPDVIVTLPNLPNPAAVRLSVGGTPFAFGASKVLSCERVLEMAEARLRRRLVFRDEQGRRTRVDSERFVSFADRHLVCLRYAVTRLDHDGEIDVQAYVLRDVANTGGVRLITEVRRLTADDLDAVECITNESQTTISIAQVTTRGATPAGVVLDVFAATGAVGIETAVSLARQAAAKGFDACLAEHVDAYRREADGASVEFDDNPATVQGFNFSQMHLQMAFCYGDSRVGIPIKGLTGHGYRFVNFWDMDFHMFPYFLMTKPRQARRLLEYRFNQLPAYRENARIWGANGAQVPWETNTRGVEETAPWLCLQDREIHISADAAYMFKLYDELTPDHEAMVSMGAQFTMETARFYASRIAWVAERQRCELRNIGCPDQYHTFAHNNLFISLMARWNLRQAIALAADAEYADARSRAAVTGAELADWRAKADTLFIPAPGEDGIIEECDGFFGLDPDIDGISELYCRHTQAVKQADVVAAFAYFEDAYPEEVRRSNWQFYNDRTLHGSSLSLPGMAYGAARCGLNDEALYNLHKSTRMDLDDVNLDTERGVHVSAGAVQWYTVVFGFGGLTPRRECLHFQPRLPRQWESLRFTVHWQFQRLRVTVTRGAIAFESDAGNTAPVAVRVGPGQIFHIRAGGEASRRLRAG